jgi:hypothetical protein
MRLMKANVFTAPELAEAALKNTEVHSDLNAFVNFRDRDTIMKEAEASQIRIEKSKSCLFFSLTCIHLSKR